MACIHDKYFGYQQWVLTTLFIELFYRLSFMFEFSVKYILIFFADGTKIQSTKVIKLICFIKLYR